MKQTLEFGVDTSTLKWQLGVSWWSNEDGCFHLAISDESRTVVVQFYEGMGGLRTRMVSITDIGERQIVMPNREWHDACELNESYGHEPNPAWVPYGNAGFPAEKLMEAAMQKWAALKELNILPALWISGIYKID